MCVGAMLIVSRAAQASVEAGKEKSNAAEAPKVNNGESSARADSKPGYTTYTNFSQVMRASDAQYPDITRVSDPRTMGCRVYTGFFFHQCLQFDATGHCLLGMWVYLYHNRLPGNIPMYFLGSGTE
jgi:hypothetical protein